MRHAHGTPVLVAWRKHVREKELVRFVEYVANKATGHRARGRWCAPDIISEVGMSGEVICRELLRSDPDRGGGHG